LETQHLDLGKLFLTMRSAQTPIAVDKRTSEIKRGDRLD
jgi:hypothetical protein